MCFFLIVCRCFFAVLLEYYVLSNDRLRKYANLPPNHVYRKNIFLFNFILYVYRVVLQETKHTPRVLLQSPNQMEFKGMFFIAQLENTGRIAAY